jgi:4-hydroxy-2-oxoheptanedioate aldolase
MIETEQAVRNIDEILSTPGLDAIFVGPSDLSVSMGAKPGFDPRSPHVYEAICSVAAAAQRHGVPAGIHTGSVAYTQEMIGLGYQFFAYLSELRFMALYSTDALAALRSGTAQAATAKANSY